MRTYAAYIAEDKNAVTDCLIHGTQIKHLVDKNGKKMADWYLKEELTKIEPSFGQVYDQPVAISTFQKKHFISPL